MAADYWKSTQNKNWLFDDVELSDLRNEIDKRNRKVIELLPLPDRRSIFIFLRDRILQLAKRLPFRQQCVATALVYLHRYFLYNAMQNVNLYLLTATTFYLASKTEEAPHHIRLVVSEARQMWPEYIPSDPSRLGEMEFCLISELQSQLIVWHPYRSLASLKEYSKLALTNEELSLAWSIVNDTFMTDLPLKCPPYLIAVTAMFLAVVFMGGRTSVDIKSPMHDANAMVEAGRFSSLGGRPGISASIGQAMSNTNVSPNSNMGPPASAVQKPSAVMTRERAVAMAMSSERMQSVVNFLIESDIDVVRMIEATQEIISLYELWEHHNEKTIKDAITKCIRQQHLDS